MAEKDHVYANTSADRAAALEQIQQQLTAGSARVAQQRAQCQAILREVRLARAAVNDSSWELADVEQRLRELTEQREGPGDQLLEREIAHLAGRRAQLEERALTQLLLIDEGVDDPGASGVVFAGRAAVGSVGRERGLAVRAATLAEGVGGEGAVRVGPA